MERCVFCQGSVDPATRRCLNCGQAQPVRTAVLPVVGGAASGGLTKNCQSCGETLPMQAHFCRRCGQPQPTPLNFEETRITGVPLPPGVAGGWSTGLPTLPAAPQTGIPSVSSTLAASQAGAPSVPLAGAGPQAGTPGVPTAPWGPQAGTPSIPSAPAGPQAGAPSLPNAPAGPQTGQALSAGSKAARLTGKGVTQGLRAKLLGTTAAKVIFIAVMVTAVATASAAGVALTRPGAPLAHLLSQPTPVPLPKVTVQSLYHVGSLPAGSTTTTLHVQGSLFAGHALVTFLLNGQPAPGAEAVKSDAQGRVQTDLTITADWPLGTQALSARDAAGHHPLRGAQVVIVPQGEAHTPGPNGSPPDDATFIVKMQLSKEPCSWLYFCDTDQRNFLMVTGHLDPTGGTVCGPLDDGQSHTFPFQGGGGSETFITGCGGTYKAGAFTYMQTEQSYTSSDGTSCTWVYTTVPLLSMQGNFNDPMNISGNWTLNYGAGTINCTDGTNQPFDFLTMPDSGTWTGMITTGP